jgi:hypothetical protein
MNNSYKLGSILKIALNAEMQRRDIVKYQKASDDYMIRMIISSVKEAEAKQQKELEDIIRIKDEEIERLTHICDILKNTNDILGKQF